MQHQLHRANRPRPDPAMPQPHVGPAQRPCEVLSPRTRPSPSAHTATSSGTWQKLGGLGAAVGLIVGRAVRRRGRRTGARGPSTPPRFTAAQAHANQGQKPGGGGGASDWRAKSDAQAGHEGKSAPSSAQARHQTTGPNQRPCRSAQVRTRAQANPAQRPCGGRLRNSRALLELAPRQGARE